EQSQRHGFEQPETGSTQQGQLRGVGGENGGRNATDTDSRKRRKRWMHTPGSETTERHTGTFDTRSDGRTWDNFPTQPPVRGRNDGFPRELDSGAVPGIKLTESKWRQEAIKAYGNAIVPQVAYQIFKAIQQY